MFGNLREKQDFETGIKPLQKQEAVWQLAHDKQCALHCEAALGCEVALTQQVLVAWSASDWFGDFALIKITVLQPHLHPLIPERHAVTPVELLCTPDFKPINC